MVTEIWLFESSELSALDFCLWGWLKSAVYKKGRCIEETNCSLAILDAAARFNKPEDQLRRETRDLRKRVANGTEVDGGIFEH